MDTLHSGEFSVGDVAREYGVTVRTLHHYDEIALLSPRGRSAAGYRLYSQADLQRLAQIVVYRRLGFTLEEIAELLTQDSDVLSHLRRQRAAVRDRVAELTDLIAALDRALERASREAPNLEDTMDERNASPAELKELFGDGYHDEYAAQAQERWGDTEAWQQSQRRTSRYSTADWAEIKAEMDQVNQRLVEALSSGEPASSTRAMDAAEAHRRHIHDRFYDLSYAMHRGLGDMYLGDPRFTATYENLHPGLAQYVRDAIHANADRHSA